MGEPLRADSNPFMSGGPRLGRPLQTALAQVVQQIHLKAPIVLVAGTAGSGKSLLAEMVTRACSERSLSVRCVDRGDMMHMALGERSDVLLVDEADAVADSYLQTLSAEAGKSAATTTVFLGLPACTNRFISLGIQPVVVELTLLSPPEVRRYLLETAADAGLPNLFAGEALNLIVQGSGGTPRILKSMASFAFFVSASEGASQITPVHVRQAAAAQDPLGGRKPGQPDGRILLGIEDQKDLDLPSSAGNVDETIQQAPSNKGAPVDGDRIAHTASLILRVPKTSVEEVTPLSGQNVDKTRQLVSFEVPIKDQIFARLPLQNRDDTTRLNLGDDGTPLESEENEYLPSNAENIDQTTELVHRDSEAVLEDGKAYSPFHSQKGDQSTPLALLSDQSVEEEPKDAYPLLTELRSNRAATNLHKTRKDPSADFTIGKGSLLAITAFVIAVSFALGSISPSILTSPSVEPSSTSVPTALNPLPVEEFSFITPPALPVPAPPVSGASEAGVGVKDTPALSESDKIAEPEKSATDRPTAAGGPLPTRGRATRTILTEQEKAAVARGIQELENEREKAGKGGKDAADGAAEVLVRAAKSGRAARTTLTEEEKAAVARGIEELARDAGRTKSELVNRR